MVYTTHMHAYILSGGTPSSRAAYIQAQSSPHRLHLVSSPTTITLEQIHTLLSQLTVQTAAGRLVWIEEANLLSLPAQNALLKTLEEPPSRTTIYLTCQSALALLPTVRSRCQIIRLKEPEPSTINHLSSLKEIMSLSPGDRLANLPKRDRSQSLAWLAEIQTALSLKFTDSSLTEKSRAILAQIARATQSAHAALSANCSVTLTTHHFLLSLPKTK